MNGAVAVYLQNIVGKNSRRVPDTDSNARNPTPQLALQPVNLIASVFGWDVY